MNPTCDDDDCDGNGCACPCHDARYDDLDNDD